jgi:hypothetical protein
MLTQKKISQLLKSGNWMIRFDNDGKSYNGFKWKPTGQWTEAPDWHTKAECNGGLFGQNAKAYGFYKPGSRLVLCETKGEQIVVDKNKVKVQFAKIIALNDKIPPVFLECVGGSLYLRGYQHPLPAGLTSVGGSLYLEGYQHPLPAGLRHKEHRQRLLKGRR